MTWRNSSHVLELRKWVNRHYPQRDKRSDGTIGNAAHRATKSDHNPDPQNGVVRAFDIDADLIPKAKDRSEAYRLAEMLRNDGKFDRRPIAYVIFSGKIASPKRRWKWRKYTGNNPHLSHIHVSFRETANE